MLPVVLIKHVLAHTASICAISFGSGIDGIIIYIAIVYVDTYIICIAYLAIFHIHVNDTEGSSQQGVLTIYIYVVHGLVSSHRFRIIVRDVNNIAIAIHYVDVGIIIDYYKVFGILIPFDMRDGTIRQSIHFIKGLKALIIGIICV